MRNCRGVLRPVQCPARKAGNRPPAQCHDCKRSRAAIQLRASKATNKVQALHYVRLRVLDLLHFGLRACRTGGPLQQHAAPQRCRQCAKPRPSWRMATPRPSIHGHVGRTNAGSVVAAKKRWPNASPRIQLYHRSQCTWQGSNPWRVCHCRTCPCDPQGRVGPQP